MTHNYLYASGQLLRETYGSNTLDFFYDANGYPYALKYNGTTYYYITNLQGDVMYLIDANENTVASYEYDPYGNMVSATGTMAEINPLRYRGYYYDAELGMYYLQSRYYDPQICKFINADDFSMAGVTGTTLAYNLFAYCENNPVFNVDYWGYFSIPTWTLSWAIDAVILWAAGTFQITWLSYTAPLKFMAKKAAVKHFTRHIAPFITKSATKIAKVLSAALSWAGLKGIAAGINYLVQCGIAGILVEPVRAIAAVTSLGGFIAAIADYGSDKKFDGKIKLW